ncbi:MULTISPECIES: sodium:solute symporter family protein [unclassified Lentimonas]|uniref:sodium:solute symporter family protein n=1 Tax=unclassified Lentimonas TaxID=2630993 RepID=UPI0013218A14|nr:MULTISPECIES: sodium:solute symporter family protein [unclassified Lentimonas]CAA6679546.1 Acetate permease ActP (cation/acetate symporter) [Lentimonas sp. CC4]CAA6684782.1 Acetate permease ActP (cation/acetate symporter) [Lentimonas sp. CC6]CAA7075418.1 Acetate permease ActP (cation/acetate symporter) [Lentimonas sp. CC4]CAA7168919.1 Acetate permease ActP (cation/acetate symporter) [Lentimonas sp. CC21]CAA7182172.1 Acetate permease ActP (cation/acetate symporter) [Lentimonas sp. CC8]
MTQDHLNFIFIGLSFALYIGIAVKSRAGSTKEYYTAGGGVSPLANGMATAADWMSAATFISMAGTVAMSGYDASRFLMGWTGGFVLLTILMVPYLRKFNKATVPDFVGDRYYSKLARGVAVGCAIFICMTYIMGQMRGVGVVFSQLFGISITSGVIIGGTIVFFYAGLGGMKGITYTQVAQYCVMAFAYTIPAIFIAMALTGNVLPQMGLIGNYIVDGESVPFLEKLNTINTELGFAEYTSGKLSTVNMFCITAALMCGTAGLPHVIVRFFTVKNVGAVRKSACWTLLFIAVIYLTAPAIGAFARVNLVDKLHDTPYVEAPYWLQEFEETGQMAWVDKNGDGKIQYYGPGKSDAGTNAVFQGKTPTYPTFEATEDQLIGKHGERLLANKANDSNPNELWFGNDIMVMANPHMAGLPKWVIALLMAGCIAAALSTAAGLLLVLSTSISHDLMKKILKPDLSDKEEVSYARFASFVALAVAVYFGINPPSQFIAKTVAFAFGLAASSFFPTLLMGIFSKRMNREGAIAGMLSGILFTFGYITYFQFLDGTPDQYLFGITPEGIGFVGMLINFVVAFVVSAFTPAPPKEVQEMVENIHIPSGSGEASHH